MELEDLLRYSIPGYIVLIPLILIFLVFSTVNIVISGEWPAAFITAIVLIGPAVGFLVHQSYMLIYEKSLYSIQKHSVLALINDRVSNNLPQDKLMDKNFGRISRLAWDTFLVSNDIPQSTRDFIIRTRFFIHSFMGMMVSFTLGLIIMLVGFLVSEIINVPYNLAKILLIVFGFFYFLATIFLRLKALQTKSLLDTFEREIAIKNWSTLHSMVKFVKNNELEIFNSYITR